MAPDTAPPAPPDGETDPFTLAEQKRWLDLARLGKDAWNTWATEELKKPPAQRVTVDLSDREIDHDNFMGFVFPGTSDFASATFSGNTFFWSATFSGNAFFRSATFSGDAFFGGTTFSGNAAFEGTTFSGAAHFAGATFSGGATFAGTTFSGNATFASAEAEETLVFSDARIAGALFADGAQFKGPTYFQRVDFVQPPAFNSTAFAHNPSFLGATVGYPLLDVPFKRFLGWCALADGDARYRRLKQLAAEAHDHETELTLFALETKAKRFHVLKLTNPFHYPSLALNYLYEWTSGFGQSVMRPTAGLALVFSLALYAFAALAGEATILGRSPLSFDGAVWTAAAVNLFPFAGQAVIGREIMKAGLCPPPDHVDHMGCLENLYAIGAVEGFFALVFLFLIGLGLRNRFRIK